MENIKSRMDLAKSYIKEADYIIIGAGAGLSEAAGFHYSGDRFNHYFKEYKEKYGISNMYAGSFYDFKTEEEKWAYWARMIQCNTYDTRPTPVYQQLLKLVKGKEYFVVTTNTDHQFYINGFDMSHYFETQGNFRYIQCFKGCHDKIYSSQSMVREMVKNTIDCKIPTSLIPKCPVCGGKMEVHVRKDQYFVETKGWHNYLHQYENFIKKAISKKVIFLEFGVGFNTPGIIRYPFEKIVNQYENAHLIRFNRDYPFSLKGNEKNVVCFDEDILKVLEGMEENDNNEPRKKREISN